jgi:mxaJ protein
MSSVCSALVAFAIAATLGAQAAAATSPPAAAPLRVCADPNNLPFSNQDGKGFENAIARLVARDLHRPLAYFWLPQRRGFIRNTLDAGRCDLVIGVPAPLKRLQTTRPYYRSSYAFVTRRDRRLRIDSFDDPRLKTLRIGIQITGEDYDNPPAAQALASRQIIQNVRGFPVYGDYSQPEPQRELIDAVADRRIDVAVMWGPLAGFYARRQSVALDLVPVSPAQDALVFAFDIAMGVRREDQALRAALDALIVRRQSEIRTILVRFGVPLE